VSLIVARIPSTLQLLMLVVTGSTGESLMLAGLNTVSREKTLTLPKDVTAILRKLFSIDYMTKFSSTRNELYLSLFINLAVDCCSRISEILAPGDTQHGDRCLRVEHIKLYAVRLDGRVTLQAKVQYKGPKGRTLARNKQKTIPLRLLPLELAAEDTLRQLVTLLLIDDVFESIKSWIDFKALDAGPNGTLIRFKDSEKGKPMSITRIAAVHLCESQLSEASGIPPCPRQPYSHCGASQSQYHFPVVEVSWSRAWL
jgi:hypothetical protein